MELPEGLKKIDDEQAANIGGGFVEYIESIGDRFVETIFGTIHDFFESAANKVLSFLTRE